jgi:protein tyrosine phosphatase (PTP) superfamily phosphohydrolase (DUF442 family)
MLLTMTEPESKPTLRASRMLPRLLALAGLVAVGLLVWQYAIKPNVIPKNFGVVEPGKLYRSGELTPAATKRVVEQNSIKTIIDLGAYDKDPAEETRARRTAEALGVERRVFRLEGDGRGNPNAYVEVLQIMSDPAKQPVLVHCSAGAQRTSACILLYRNIVQGKPFAETAHEAYAHRHNPGDNRELWPWLLDHHAAITQAFRDHAAIAGEPAAERTELSTPARSVSPIKALP